MELPHRTASTVTYSCPYWLTFNQARQYGGNVKKGEKGAPVILWRGLDVENKETCETDRVPVLRYYVVFNLTQCQGIAAPASTSQPADDTPVQAAQ